MRKIILLTLTGILLGSCGLFSKKEDAKVTDNKLVATTAVNYVDTMHLVRSTFRAQLISNGKLRAKQKSDLKFLGSGMVQTLNVENGSRVEKGRTIATLDSRQLKLALTQSKDRLQKSKIDLQDALLGFGYTSQDTTIIPKDVMRIARIRSGYDAALSDLKVAELGLENNSLTAPFSGKIANLKTKLHESPKGDFFCTVINDSSLDIEFAVLESELPKIKVGGTVSLSTFAQPDKQYRGVIKNINPTIDDKGQTIITASCLNPGSLIDGMNVKVYIENNYPQRLVVPKSAVLVRDNMNILFRFNEKTGKAMWTYVIIEDANSSSYSVVANTEREAEINPGDIVIISGNLNLADDVSVEVRR